MMEIKPQIISFEQKGLPKEGYLSIVNCFKNSFFEIKRVYWTYETPKHVIRGKHAHKKSMQILIAISGEIKITLIDVNKECQTFCLKKPNEGLLIPPNYWHTMEYSEGAVQLILSSTSYSENDYIRDFDDFLDFWKKNHL